MDVVVEPATVALRARVCAPPPSSNRDLAVRSDRFSWIGTVLVMALLVVGLTSLLGLLDRAGRRRLRDGHLRRLAFEDSLTGLPNRTLFEQRIAATLEAGEPAVVAFLDLDDFKQVNDSLGHAAGDRLLEICGQRLRNALREGDTVARLGGDEFAILAVEVTDLDAFVDRIFSVLSAPVMLEGKRLYLRASIGVATDPVRPRAAAQLRPGDVRRQGRRHQPLRVVHRGHAHQRGRAAGSSRAARARDRERGAAPALPADRRPRPRPRRRLRGPGALAAPRARLPRPRRVHPAGRGDGADRAAGPLGPARGRPPGRAVGGRAVPQRERRLGPARAAGLRRRGRLRAARRRPGAVTPRAGGHRVLAGRRPRGRAPAGAARDGRAPRDRRLRHRLLVSELPPPLPDGRPEDRPLLHPRRLRRQRAAARRSWPWANHWGWS